MSARTVESVVFTLRCTVGGAAYTYDNNGNLMSGGGRSYTWTAENLPASITSGTVTENYTYDADNERVAKAAGGATTIYFQGVFEQTVGAGWKQYYSFNGQTVAMRDNAGTVTYLHGDHLGSVSLATNSSGALASQQEFDPWGAVRSGGVGQTGLNYTGQRLDGTGLLYYHARMYDPVLARFVSADSVVPGSASGSLDGIALKPLTVDFHEVGFGATLNGENGQPFWFQMSDQQRQKAGDPWGPANPQALNRYSYVLNGPVRWTDPSGHWRGNSATFTVKSEDVDRLDSRLSRAIGNRQTAIGIGAVALGAACIASGPFTPVCEAAVAGATAVAVGRLSQDYGNLSVALQDAATKAGDDGVVKVVVERNRVSVYGYNSAGKLVYSSRVSTWEESDQALIDAANDQNIPITYK